MNGEPDYSEYDYDDDDRNDEIRARIDQISHKIFTDGKRTEGQRRKLFQEAIMEDEEIQGFLIYETRHLDAVIELEFRDQLHCRAQMAASPYRQLFPEEPVTSKCCE